MHGSNVFLRQASHYTQLPSVICRARTSSGHPLIRRGISDTARYASRCARRSDDKSAGSVQSSDKAAADEVSYSARRFSGSNVPWYVPNAKSFLLLCRTPTSLITCTPSSACLPPSLFLLESTIEYLLVDRSTASQLGPRCDRNGTGPRDVVQASTTALHMIRTTCTASAHVYLDGCDGSEQLALAYRCKRRPRRCLDHPRHHLPRLHQPRPVLDTMDSIRPQPKDCTLPPA